MKTRETETSPVPSWQDRRSDLLQKACTAIAEQVHTGKGLLWAITLIAKRLDNVELGAGRRLRLSAKTLEGYWYAWLAKGRKPSAFALHYHYSPNGQRARIDSLLLRLLIEQTLQTGAPLAEVVERLNAGGAKISLAEVRRAFPKGNVRKFERSHRQLTEHRLKLQKDFLAADEKWRRSFFKHRTKSLRKLIERDAVLERRIFRQREQLQKRFFEADARAVEQRELLQQKLLSRIEVAK